MASSSLGVSCKKPSKDVFRTQPYIQDGAFARAVNGFKYFCKVAQFQMFHWGLNVRPDVLIYINVPFINVSVFLVHSRMSVVV